MDYLDVATARTRPGLKLVLTAGAPGPWSEAAKAILRHHGLAFLPVAQQAMAANEALVAWTGCRNAPQLVAEGQPALTGWHDILAFAEREGRGPSLLPAGPEARAECLGLCALMAGPDGLGWLHRVTIMARMGATAADSPLAAAARCYGVSEAAAADAPARTAAILDLLDRRLAAGGGWLAGGQFSAADIYWATFSNMFSPLPAEVNPMPEMLWGLYRPHDARIAAALSPALLAHRDRIWRDHVGLPLDY